MKNAGKKGKRYGRPEEELVILDLDEEERQADGARSRSSNFPRRKILFALVMTVVILSSVPVYGWLHFQREIARFERISSPNTLYITAARREDQIYLKTAGIDVTGYWKNSDGTNNSRMYYKDFVFCVAGEYVPSYTLQLAHTSNNNYAYEIYEADVTKTDPANQGKILEKDYVEYVVNDKFMTDELKQISDNPVYANVQKGETLYYSVKKDDNAREVALSAQNKLTGSPVSSYLITRDEEQETVTYNGHYLNKQSSNSFLANSTGSQHTQTFGTYTSVDAHAEPLYWQASQISGGNAILSEPFYHEYILRISWSVDENDENAATALYKDTDMIYITVGAD